MANTPSINPDQISARNTAGGERFNAVLFATMDALDSRKIPFAIIGGIAASGLGRPRSTHDIDIFVRPEDAEATVQALSKAGFRTEKTDIEWLFKAFLDDILVDIVFRSRGDIYFDEEMQSRVKRIEFHGRKLPIVAPEDLIVIKSAVHYEGGPHHWHDALAILSHATIDWGYLVRRARRAARRVLALLIYAQSSDILIPNSVICSLFQHVFESEQRATRAYEPANAGGPPTHRGSVRSPAAARPSAVESVKEIQSDYLLEHIRAGLAEDERTAQQDLKILLDGQRVVVKGECSSEERRKAIFDVIRTVAPDHEVVNQVRVLPMSPPEGAEVVS